MNLNYHSIYYAKKTVKAYPGAELNGMQSKFLELGQKVLRSYGLTDVSIAIEDVSTGELLETKSAAALILRAQLERYRFTGVVTVNTFGSLCVIGSYKALDGRGFLYRSDSIEKKTRQLFLELSNLVLIEYLDALEWSIDFAADSIGIAIDEAYGAYKS